jgi:ATP-dependent 26S proteasome regulatory subunit
LAQSQRQTEESLRKTIEAQRKTEESLRKTNEAQRKTEESLRKMIEAQRKTNEAVRKTNEAVRKLCDKIDDLISYPDARASSDVELDLADSVHEKLLQQGYEVGQLVLSTLMGAEVQQG